MIVTDFLVKNFNAILDYDFTANVEKDFDQIADGKKVWNEVISEFYYPFHNRVEETLSSKEYSHVSKDLGADPSDGEKITAKYGKFGPYIQKGEGDKRQFASLGKGQLIENLTLEDALKLFKLPRTVGQYKGLDIVAMKGRFGPFIKFGDKNYSLPRGVDPVSVSLEECSALIDKELDKPAVNNVLKEFKDNDIQVINGRYGPYIKHSGANYKIPKGEAAESLTEERCNEIIANTSPTGKRRQPAKKK